MRDDLQGIQLIVWGFIGRGSREEVWLLEIEFGWCSILVDRFWLHKSLVTAPIPSHNAPDFFYHMLAQCA